MAPVRLLRRLFSNAEEKVTDQIGPSMPLLSLLAPLAYRMADLGVQTTLPDQILMHFRAVLGDQSVDLPRSMLLSLISCNILVPNAEGEVGFFHQSALEYLAAVELHSQYTNAMTLDDKIRFRRWDEIIILLVSLLPARESRELLGRILVTDLVFACQAFEAAAIQDESLGAFLFENVCRRLSQSSLSTTEKEDVAQAIRHIGPWGPNEALIDLLGNEAVAGPAAIALARKGAEDSFGAILELLVSDPTWPSEFATALTMLADEAAIPLLLRSRRDAEDLTLLDLNLEDILVNFNYECISTEILELLKSEDTNDKQLCICLLSRFGTDQVRDLLLKIAPDLLSDPNEMVVHGAIHALHRHHMVNSAIMEQVFGHLPSKRLGTIAALYLRDVAELNVVDHARERLKHSSDEIERINLALILSQSDPELTKRILLEGLDNFKEGQYQPLRAALVQFGPERIASEILRYISSDCESLRWLVFNVFNDPLYHLRGGGNLASVAESEENCQLLLDTWESSDDPDERDKLGELLTDMCPKLSKSAVLERIQNPVYPLRSELIYPLSRLSISRGDLSEDVLEWLLEKLGDEEYKGRGPSLSHIEEGFLFQRVVVGQVDDTRYQYNPVARILGKVSDERMVREILIPLTHSKNEDLREGAHYALHLAEMIVGKRYTASQATHSLLEDLADL